MHKGPNTTLDEGQTLIASCAPLPFDTTQVTSVLNRSNPLPGDPYHPLTRGGNPPAVAFQWPVDVADPITAVEGRTYTHEGTTFRTHNVVPDVHMVNMQGAKSGAAVSSDDSSFTLAAMHGHDVHAVSIAPAVAFKASHFTRGKDGAPSEIAPPLSADADKGDQDTLVAAVSIAFYPNMGAAARSDGASVELAGTLSGANGGNKQSVASTMSVRRLTPTECERLQGFPDDWTAIVYRGKPAADGPRYKALGNSMAVNVMRWIGERVSAVDSQS